ncbi:MAG TPA: hypothetical protein PL072_10615 [Phycisphaerales bacterium]|nr:hypothetical protein [Phycisphaerales bacterium]
MHMARAGLTGRLGRLEKRERGAAATPACCRCCAGIDFNTGSGVWAPPRCLVLRRNAAAGSGAGGAPPVAFAWCKFCGRCIEAELEQRPYGAGGPWRVANARWSELPV